MSSILEYASEQSYQFKKTLKHACICAVSVPNNVEISCNSLAFYHNPSPALRFSQNPLGFGFSGIYSIGSSVASKQGTRIVSSLFLLR